MRHAAGRIQPRAELKGNTVGVKRAWIEAGRTQQRAHARPLRAAQFGQPALQEKSCVTALDRHIGNDAKRHEIEQRLRSGGAGERFDDLPGGADAGELAERMIAGQQLGVHHRARSRQVKFAVRTMLRIVVVADDDVEAERDSQVGRGEVGDAAVAGEQDAHALFSSEVQAGVVEAVAGYGAVGNGEVDVRTEAAQTQQQHAGGSLSVDVEVAPDANVFAGVDRPAQSFDSCGHTGHRQRRRRRVVRRIEKRTRRIDVAAAARPQHFRDQRVNVERSGERDFPFHCYASMREFV